MSKRTETTEFEIPEGFPQAFGNTVIIYPGKIESEMEKTETGILLPDYTTGAQGEAIAGFGWVMGVGPDVTKTVIDKDGNVRNIQPGDYVQFNHYADKGVKFKARFYLVMHEIELYVYFPDKVIPGFVATPDRRRAAVELKKSGGN